jgi:hypothetical protein
LFGPQAYAYFSLWFLVEDTRVFFVVSAVTAEVVW